jgi:poly(3-hydroxybutyrate) depolymerase
MPPASTSTQTTQSDVGSPTSEAPSEEPPTDEQPRAQATPDVVDSWAPRVRPCADDSDVDCLKRIDYPVGELTRSAHVYLPPHAAVEAVPMVVVVHGLNQSPRSLENLSGWTTVARREGFAVTFPQGYPQVQSDSLYVSSWNAGWCCGAASQKVDDIDDVATMEATVQTAQTVYPSNGKVYYAGFSNGAMLGFWMQCIDQGPFAAFVAVHGTSSFSTCQPRSSRPFLAMNALLDTTVPYAGCRTVWRTSSCALALNSDLNSVRGTLIAMRRAAGCTGVQTRRYAAHVVRTDSTGCAQPGPTQLTINNARHTWVTDETRYGIDETEEAWRFLSQF